jgi:putative flavoprotein involved in K+ transport
MPGFAPELVQMHSSEYRGPSQLRPGGVLLVGAGNSGADIAMEVSKTHATWLSGPDKGGFPIRIESRLAKVVMPVLWFVASRIITVEQVPRTVGVQDGLPVLEDGRVLDVTNVIWCTGFRQDFGWIDVPVFDGDGEPQHEGGSTSEPGLYFLGLDFLYAFTSENVGGVGRDARRIARRIGKS